MCLNPLSVKTKSKNIYIHIKHKLQINYITFQQLSLLCKCEKLPEVSLHQLDISTVT